MHDLATALGAETFASLDGLARQTPDPDLALERLQGFVLSSEAARAQVRGSRRALQAALVVFANSDFLFETLVREPELLGWALDPERFYTLFTAAELRSELGSSDTGAPDEGFAAKLAHFRRIHVLRIALRDFLGVATLAEITLELSNLAGALLEGAHDHVRGDLARRFGRPLVRAGETEIEGRFVAIALGKLGGRELNYSSDIDLMYLHTGQGETSGPIRISNHDFYQQLATRLTRLLSMRTQEGFAYRVDLRLRPEGSSGELVASLDGAIAYYHKRARDWELQMLIKARPAAGDLQLGEAFLRMVRPLIYRTTTDFSLIERVSESRDRIHKRRQSFAKGGVNVKLHPGGIRDIEFLVQCLQRLYGGQDPFVRSGGTLFALHRLAEKGHLPLGDYSALSAAYQYLRTVEHRLQLLDDRQAHELPKDPAQRERLARKVTPGSSAAELGREVERCFGDVSVIYKRTIQSQGLGESEAAAPACGAGTRLAAEKVWSRQLRRIEAHSPELARAFDAAPIRRGAQMFAHFLDRVAASGELRRRLEASPELVACVGDLIEHSTAIADHLARFPQDVAELAPDADAPEPAFDPAADYNEQSMQLRRYFRRRRLHITARSVCGARPIFDTLARMSNLAEEVIGAAYRIAYEHTRERHPFPPPPEALRVIALGRLGIRELDIGSDVDLIFVLGDDAVEQEPFWSAVVTRFIETLSNYTREGRIFSVDVRLRPNGRDGSIVQTEAFMKRYFAERAEAWEALAYMKARTVAGDAEGGRRFLEELQKVGWERFGGATNLTAKLRGMRDRLEREHGDAEPIKAGPGGYFDIDFLLLYLRLESAGEFFELLSTPERIAIVRALGGLSEEQAVFVEEAAVFFRAVDHAVRVATGRPSGRIPAAVGAQESVGELVRRWSTLLQAGEPLPAVVEQVQRSTRAIYAAVLS